MISSLHFYHSLFYLFLAKLKSPKTEKETTSDEIHSTDVISHSYTSIYFPNCLGGIPSLIFSLLLGSFICMEYN
jgi:hypothetical protein